MTDTLADDNSQQPAKAERIGVGGGDDAVVKIQLAARWAEVFAPANGDSLAQALKRFRQAYDYVDAVTHGIEPAEDSASPA
jgi:hypothetical protein